MKDLLDIILRCRILQHREIVLEICVLALDWKII